MRFAFHLILVEFNDAASANITFKEKIEDI